MNEEILSATQGEGDSGEALDSDTMTLFVEAILKRDADTGYPAMAAIFFNADEESNVSDATGFASSETMTITSADNLQLSGTHFAPENSSGNWVILITGYGRTKRSMNPFVEEYVGQGYDVLAIDLRATGDSEGEWITMGVAESHDVALWTQKIAEIDSNAKIVLHGVSEGAATAIMAAADSDATNVASVVEDCGYTDIRTVFESVVSGTFLASVFSSATVFDALFDIAENLTGYDVQAAAPINFIDDVTVPTLFINGSADEIVPPEMAQALYNASGAAVKDILIVEGAGHAQSGVVDYDAYRDTVFEFVGGSEMDTTIIAQGATTTIDGVVYTAIDGEAQLNLDSDGKVTGIASGKVTAEIANTDTSPTITFDASAGAFEFTVTAAETLNVRYGGLNIHYATGAGTYTASSIEIPAGEISVGGSINGLIPYALNFNVLEATTINFADGKISANANENLAATITLADTPIASLTLKGGIAYDIASKELSLTEGTAINVSAEILDNLDASVTALDDVSCSFALDTTRLGLTITPGTDDGAIAVTLKQGGVQLFDGEINCTAGAVTYLLGRGFSFASGTVMEITVNGVTLTTTTASEEPSTIGLEDGKITFTPGSDNSLNLEVSVGGTQILGNEISVTDGTITFDPETNEVTVSNGTKLSVTSDELEVRVDLEITGGNAGGTISTDGGKILYTPNTGDGIMNIGVTLLSSEGSDVVTIPVNLETTGNSFGFDTNTNSLVFTEGNAFTVSLNEYTASAEIVGGDANISLQPVEGGVKIIPGENDGSLSVNITRDADSETIFAGTLTVDGAFSIGIDEEENPFLSIDSGVTVSFAQGDYELVVTSTDAAGLKGDVYDTSLVVYSEGGDGTLDVSIKRNGETIFASNVELIGSVAFDPLNKVLRLLGNSSLISTVGDYQFTVSTPNSAAVTDIGIVDSKIVLTPHDEYSTINLSASRNGTTIIDNLALSVSDGSILLDSANRAIGLTGGTTLNFAFGDYEVTAATTSDASVSIVATDTGIAITPETGDGSLDITLSTANGSLSANIEVLSGSFILGENGAISVAKDTELAINFGDDYSVNFKATDEAGGTISLDENGITFAPNSNDGGLELSVNRNGETRATNLNVNGSVTYKLDGSISLAQGTTVTNEFASGRTLTITANADTSGTIHFTPDSGLTIASSDSGALTVTLAMEGTTFNFTEMSGGVTYSGGRVTLADGTEISGSSSHINAVSTKTEGGSSIIDFSSGSEVSYIPGDGATITSTFGSSTTVTLSGGNMNIHVEDNHASISLTDGITFTGAIPFAITLETAGTYTLNGNEITTTSDGVEILLSDYETVENSHVITENGENFTVDSRTFNMITDAPTGVTVTTGENTFDVAHTITEAEVGKYENITSADIGKVFEEKVTIAGDDSYTVSSRDYGVSIVSGLSNGASVNAMVVFDGVENENGAFFSFVTDEEGTFTFGDKSYTITGDDNVTLAIDFNADGTAELNSYAGLDEGASIIGVNAIIKNSATGVVVTGTDSDDNISNSGDNVTIRAGGGDDLVTNLNASKVYIDAGDGDNLVVSYLEYTIDGAADTLTNYYERETVVTGSGDDVIINYGGYYVSVSSGGGNDLIRNFHSYYSTIDAGAGDDEIIILNGHYQYVDAGEGNDTIRGSIVSGDDENWATGGYATLLGGDGDDYISPGYTNNAVIDGGAGSDFISISGIENLVIAESGDDTIYGVNSTTTIQTAEILSAELDGRNVILKTDEGSITIVDGRDKVINVNDKQIAAGAYKISGPATLSGMAFSGDGKVTMAGGSVTLSAGVAIDGAEAVVLTKKGTATVNGQAFWLTENVPAGVTVSTIDDGIGAAHIVTADDVPADDTVDVGKIFYEEAYIYGDDSYSVRIDKGGIRSIYGLSNGATVEGRASLEGEEDSGGSVLVLGLDEAGVYTFGGENYTIGAPTSDTPVGVNVRFFNDNTTRVSRVRYLDGNTISGSFANVSVDGSAIVSIAGDDSIDIVGGRKTASVISGVSDGATIYSSGGANRIITDEAGEFAFGGQNFTIGGDDSVEFILDSNGSVTGVNNLENATLTFDSGEIAINGGDNITLEGAPTLTVAEGEIVSIGGVDAVKNLTGNVTVHGTGAMNVNRKEINVDGDDDFDVIVSDGRIVEIVGLDSGDFTVGGTAYTVDADPIVFATDRNGAVVDIENLNGAIVSSARTNTINGAAITVSDTEATIFSAGEGIASVNGFADGTTITTAENILVPLNNASTVTINRTTYELSGDRNGVSITGGNIVGLDSGATLKVSSAGNYTVDGATFEAKAGDIFVGTRDGAYIYNSKTAPIAADATTEEILERFNGAEVVSETSTIDGGVNVIGSNTAGVTLSAEGDSTIISSGDNVAIDMENAAALEIVPLAGNISIENYNADKLGIKTGVANIGRAIDNGEINLRDGEIKVNDATVAVDSDSDSTLVNLIDIGGESQLVGFTDFEGGTLDISDRNDSAILIGGQNGGSEITGGKGDDTIVAGGNDTINGGAGDNFVELATSRRTASDGATIELPTVRSATIVENFRSGFNAGDDKIAADIDTAKISFDGEAVTIKDGKARVVLNDIGEDNSAKVMIGDSRAAVVAKGASATVGGEIADYYVGNKSALDFSGYANAVSVNLSTGTGNIGGNNASLDGFNGITAGSGNTTLIGSGGNEIFTAGSGDGSIYGGGGRDTLVGYTGNDKNGATEFFVTEDRATITGFDFDSDLINTVDKAVESIGVSGDNVYIEIADGGRIMVDGAAGRDFNFKNNYAEVVAQVSAGNLSYDGRANYFNTASRTGAAVEIINEVDDAEVWLDNSKGAQFHGNIRALDGSKVTGNTTLVGNDGDNIITAGSGNSSLWGGTGGNDTLIGGEGADLFWYEIGNGNDKIRGAGENDRVNLYGVTVDMLTTEVSADSIRINFNDGGSLTLDTNSGTTFTLGDGSSYVYDKAGGEWRSR